MTERGRNPELKQVTGTLAVIAGFYHLLIVGGVFSALGIFVSPLIHRAISLGLALILLFLLFPAYKKGKGRTAWYDVLFIVLGVVPLGFMVIYGDVMNDYNMRGTVDLKGLIFAFSLLFVLLEGARRVLEAFPVR